MKLRFTILLCVCVFSYAFAQADLPAEEGRKITATVNSFLTAVKKGTFGDVGVLLYPTVQVKAVNQNDLKKMIDDLISAKISAVDYIATTTGNNIALFAVGNETKSCSMLDYTVASGINIDEIEIKPEVISPVYFIQVMIVYNETTKQTAAVVKKNKKAEIEVVPYKNSYRIIGFIF